MPTKTSNEQGEQQEQREKTVQVTLRRSYGYRGQMYGPGEAVEVPAALAEALGLVGVEPVAPAPAPEETGGTGGTDRAEGGVGSGDDSRSEYEAQDKAKLERIASRRGLTVEGTGANGAVLKTDLVEALVAADAKAKG